MEGSAFLSALPYLVSSGSPCSKLRVMAAARVLERNAGSSIFLGTVGALVKGVERVRNMGRLTWSRFTRSVTHTTPVALDVDLVGLAKFMAV